MFSPIDGPGALFVYRKFPRQAKVERICADRRRDSLLAASSREPGRLSPRSTLTSLRPWRPEHPGPYQVVPVYKGNHLDTMKVDTAAFRARNPPLPDTDRGLVGGPLIPALMIRMKVWAAPHSSDRLARASPPVVVGLDQGFLFAVLVRAETTTPCVPARNPLVLAQRGYVRIGSRRFRPRAFKGTATRSGWPSGWAPRPYPEGTRLARSLSFEDSRSSKLVDYEDH